MNKKDFIKAVQSNTTLSTVQCNDFYNAMVFVLTDALKKGEEINLTGLGKFATKIRKPRKVTNPKTKQLMTIPSKITPYFKASKKLKDNLF